MAAKKKTSAQQPTAKKAKLASKASAPKSTAAKKPTSKAAPKTSAAKGSAANKAASKVTAAKPKPAKAAKGTPVSFAGPLLANELGRVIVRLPDAASKQLPSRGQVAVDATVKGHAFQTVLEPDGDFGHFMNVDDALRRATGLAPGDTVAVEVVPSGEWPEPDVPGDLRDALTDASADIQDLWRVITPMARWEWVRWVNETKNAGTRQKRVEVSIDKLRKGKRRPCCFNLASCTDPELAKSGKLALR
ncbi:MAG: DUF1905 domain-containing protein [Sandaracinaceae bacterium]|nr:DUF1905 domain-containing protein [Sandaracinaceae bacterium]